MSLRHLRTERLDLWQLHRVDPQVPVGESLGISLASVALRKVSDLRKASA